MADDTRPACCAPQAARGPATPRSDTPIDAPSERLGRAGEDPPPAPESAVYLGGGTFLMGSDDPSFPADGEGPVREVALSPFRLSPTTVTNAEFAAFVAATGHRTEAEAFGWSFVFAGFLPNDFPPTRGVAAAPWWRQVYDADWRRPEGPHTAIDDRSDHPAIHLTWNDASAYAAWVGGRLPTEAEWEFAARGGLEQKRYPWGDRLVPDGRWRCNIWQGTFPVKNSAKDGWRGTAPVTTFEPNGYGLYNMAGNVWEWCSDRWSTDHHRNGPTIDPQGPPTGDARVTKGGSYMCHASYCNRYRVSARTQNTPDSSTGHVGVRVAWDA
jgi:formylglycine-generating enzyme required for sulfatase activity